MLAFEFLVLTACRSGEVRGALWNEMDFDARDWRIPAERMKTQREHRVPLSGRALAVLREAQRLADGSGLVFPSARGRLLSEAATAKMVRNLRIGAVPHGFRSSFRDWAAERTDVPREVCELALAHVNRNRVEGRLPAIGPVRAAAGAYGGVERVPCPSRTRCGAARMDSQRRTAVLDQRAWLAHLGCAVDQSPPDEAAPKQ